MMPTCKGLSEFPSLSYLWVVKSEVIFSLYLCALLEFETINVSSLRHPKIIFQKYYHSPIITCTSDDALLLEKPCHSLPAWSLPGGLHRLRYPRGHLLKIKVENIQLCNYPHKHMIFRGTGWMKWDSETLELLIKYTQVFSSLPLLLKGTTRRGRVQKMQQWWRLQKWRLQHPRTEWDSGFLKQPTGSQTVLLKKLLVSQQPLHIPTYTKHTQQDTERPYRK